MVSGSPWGWAILGICRAKAQLSVILSPFRCPPESMSRPKYLWIALLAAPLIAAHAAPVQRPIAPLAAYDELIGTLMSEAESIAWNEEVTEPGYPEWVRGDEDAGANCGGVRRAFVEQVNLYKEEAGQAGEPP